jgi:hypothetical protein
MREDGWNQLQILAPLPLKEIFRMISLSAKLISLDSPFKAFSNFLFITSLVKLLYRDGLYTYWWQYNGMRIINLYSLLYFDGKS